MLKREYTITEKNINGRVIYTVCRILESYSYPVPLGGRVKYQYLSLNHALDHLDRICLEHSQ